MLPKGDPWKTPALGEVFHKPSTAASYTERERVSVGLFFIGASFTIMNSYKSGAKKVNTFPNSL